MQFGGTTPGGGVVPTNPLDDTRAIEQPAEVSGVEPHPGQRLHDPLQGAECELGGKQLENHGTIRWRDWRKRPAGMPNKSAPSAGSAE